jgi:hypothetical protein
VRINLGAVILEILRRSFGWNGIPLATSLAPPGLATEPVAQEFGCGTFVVGSAIDEGQVLGIHELADERVAPVARVGIGPDDRRVNDHAIPSAGPEAQRPIRDPCLSVDD